MLGLQAIPCSISMPEGSACRRLSVPEVVRPLLGEGVQVSVITSRHPPPPQPPNTKVHDRRTVS